MWTSLVTAICEATVRTSTGAVVVDVENEYLPRVVACENGNAAPAALEAQAIAARSYLYYIVERRGPDGWIGDGTSDQVYTCDRPPRPEHRAAVRATAGMVLRYRDTQVAGFYVAGGRHTEAWVTRNDGRSGDAVRQTPLGFVDDDNHANRGCMSQIGSDALADAGRDREAILRAYYGDDIEIVRAEGPCAAPAAQSCRAGYGALAGFAAGWWILRRRRRRRR